MNDSSELRRELFELEEKHRRLKRDYASRGRNLSQVEAEKAELVAVHEAENAAMAEENRQLRELNVALVQRVGEPERSSNPFSGNSGKPPSSDGFAKPSPDEKKRKRVFSLRGKSKLRSGGQPGHRGATLRWAEKPDRIIDLVPKACHRCRKEFPEGAESERYVARQVHDSPESKLVADEYRNHSLRRDCGAVTEGTFPEGVNSRVQYGPRLTGAAAYLHVCRHLPLRRPEGPQTLFERPIGPLYSAMPDLERRDWLEMTGTDANGQVWVGLGGEYCGVLEAPWLGVPPTFRAAAMRFHEFFRIEDGRAVEMQALWDIPELMMQAGA